MFRTALIICLGAGAVLGGTIGCQAEEQADQAPWKIRLELSHVRTSGNTDTETLSGKLEAKKEGEIHRYILKGSALHAEDEGKETANKWLLDGRWERVLRRDLFGFLTASYLRDKFSGYDYRANGGPGLGYDFIKTKQHQVKGLLSTLYSRHKFSEADKGSESYVSGKAAIHYVWEILENVRFKESADYLVSFEDTDTYFINSETALEVEVNGTVALGLSYGVAYQHRPPSPDIERTDTLFLTSLIINF